MALTSSSGFGSMIDRREAVARVLLDDQRAVRHRDRAEEAGLRIAHRLEVAGRELVAEDVGNAGEVGAAVQVAAVGREDEALRNGPAEIVLRHGLRLAGLEVFAAEHAQELRAVERPDRHRQQRAVGRDVELEGLVAVRPGVDLVPARVGVGDANQGHVAVEVPQAPQRPVRRVEAEVADARVLEQHARLARGDVHRHQVPPGVVVRGVEQRPGARIVGGRRHPVFHRSLDVDELADAAVGESRRRRHRRRRPDTGRRRSGIRTTGS